MSGRGPATVDLVLEYVPLHELATYHRNPRRGDVDRIKESLKVHSQYRPIAVNRGSRTGRPNEVLAGNHTLMAARDLGWESMAVTFVDVDDDQAARIVAADNRTADLGDYDNRLLLELLADLPDLDGTGYDPGDLEDLERALAAEELPGEGATDPDAAPDLPVEPVSMVGDVWQLGPHRLVVGDATDADVWEQLLPDGAPAMVWTDPPYNVAVAGGTHDARDKKNHGKGPRIQNDAMSDGDFRDFLRSAFGLMCTALPEGGAIYVCHADTEGINFRSAFAEAGFFLHEVLIWAKQEFVFGRSDYHWQHEPILYGWRPGAAHSFYGERNQSTVWQIDRPMRSEKEHPTQKPVALPFTAITNSSQPLERVLDPFAGTGSTLIACHQLGRHARLIELDPKYADVILRRYQEHTGLVPTRDGTEHDFTSS